MKSVISVNLLLQKATYTEAILSPLSITAFSSGSLIAMPCVVLVPARTPLERECVPSVQPIFVCAVKGAATQANNMVATNAAIAVFFIVIFLCLMFIIYVFLLLLFSTDAPTAMPIAISRKFIIPFLSTTATCSVVGEAKVKHAPLPYRLQTDANEAPTARGTLFR